MGTLGSTATCEAEQATEHLFSIDREAIVLAPLETPREQRLYYGWYMLLMAMGASIASSPGQTFGVSIFNEPLRMDLGLTHGQLGLAYMLGTLLGAAPIIWIGLQMDRHGIRRTMLVAVTCFSGACFLMAFAQNWLHVVACFTLLRMLGPGALSLLSGNVLPFWFSRRLGTVEGLRQTAMAMAMHPAAEHLVGRELRVAKCLCDLGRFHFRAIVSPLLAFFPGLPRAGGAIDRRTLVP